jgi:hypothetical protein
MLEGENVRAHSAYSNRQKTQPLTDLMNMAAELERKLDDVRLSLEYGSVPPAGSAGAMPDHRHGPQDDAFAGLNLEHDADRRSAPYSGPQPRYYGDEKKDDHADSAEWRTEALLSRGRHNSYRPRLSRGRKAAIGLAAVAALVTVLALMLFRGGASWPSSVMTVQREAAQACQNPNVKSEPGQVNFACAKATRPILWVFAMMTSADNPDFNDPRTGRLGLEPITPAQGGQVAWSLNLHHPYSPYNPVDSLEVAARAINSIIGGATLTSAAGRPVVQAGLESHPANCIRYTGSARVIKRAGFPSLCAKPVATPAGQAALVADVYQKWVVGAPPRAAQDAAVLFENADNPGDPRVLAILRHLPESRPA